MTTVDEVNAMLIEEEKAKLEKLLRLIDMAIASGVLPPDFYESIEK